MTGRRRGVFDPARLDDLSDVLAPPQQPAAGEGSSDGSPNTLPAAADDDTSAGVAQPNAPARTPPAQRGSPSESTSSEPTRPSPRSRSTSGPARNTSGRQPRAPGGRIATAVRIPAEVYQEVNEHLLVGAERPSYGQLVMWAVEDHRREVMATVEAALPDPADRSPRGRRLAQDRVPIGLQLLASERTELDELANEIASSAVAASRGARVTRTDVATAALRVAVQERRGQLG